MGSSAKSIYHMYRRYFRSYTRGLIMAGLCYMAFAAEGSIMAGLSRYLVDDVLEVNLMHKSVLSGSSGAPVNCGDISPVVSEEPLARNKDLDCGKIAGKADGMSSLEVAVIAKDGSLEDRIASREGKTTWEKLRLLMIIAVILIVMHLTAVVMQTWANYKLGVITEQVIFRIRRHIHDKLLRLQMSFHNRNQTGRLLSRATDDVNVIQNTFASIMTQFAMFIGLIIINVSIMFYIHVKLAALSLLAMPFYAFAYSRLRGRIRELSWAQRRENASIYALVRDKLANPRVVKSFGKEKREHILFFGKVKKLFRYGRRIVVLNNVLSMICTCISVFVSAFVLGYGTILLRNGELTLGYLLFFYSVAYGLFWPIAALTQITANAQRLRVSCERILGILDEPIEIVDRKTSREFSGLRDKIVLDNVSFKYNPDSNYALDGVNLEIKAGSKICLMGSSGAGKSTLGVLLLRLYDPVEGKISVDGIDLRDIKISSLRKKISYVPQEPLLFSGTLASNILYGNPGAGRDQMVKAAKLAEIHDFIESLPDGYDTMIGENGLRLSGGQKQRISLARALVTEPDILILDDCTSALDAKTEANIQKTIRTAMEGKTVIMITHRVSLSSNADMIVVLDKGKVVQTGKHEELIEKQGHYWNLVKDQLEEKEVITLRRQRAKRFAAA